MKHTQAITPTEATYGFIRFLCERGMTCREETVETAEAIGRVCCEPVRKDGRIILQRGAEITPETAVILAECGIETVKIAARPLVTFVVGMQTKQLTVLAGIVQSFGAVAEIAAEVDWQDDELIVLSWTSDVLDRIDGADVIVTVSSADKFDRLVGEDGGFAPCVSVRPGGQTRLGAYGSVPVIDLPEESGEAVAAIKQFLRPVIGALTLSDGAEAEHVCMTMGAPLSSPEPIRTFVPASIGLNSDGMLAAIPMVGDDPLERLAVNCYVDIPATGKTYETGDRASAILLRPVSEIESTVRIAGRADALLLCAANALHTADARRRAQVLPMDDDSAMELLENGIVPMAAVSTQDAETGEWNLPLCEKHGSDGLAVIAFAVKDGERIDLVTSLDAMKDAGVKTFLQALQSDAFSVEAKAYPDCDTSETGTVRKIWMTWG